MQSKILPIGTVVYFEDMDKTFMIIGRAMQTEQKGELKLFDYCGCMFPEGLINSKLIYFNQDDIDDIVFRGLINSDEVAVSKYIIDNIGDKLSTEFKPNELEKVEW